MAATQATQWQKVTPSKDKTPLQSMASGQLAQGLGVETTLACSRLKIFEPQ
jgi:hypothetical protein